MFKLKDYLEPILILVDTVICQICRSEISSYYRKLNVYQTKPRNLNKFKRMNHRRGPGDDSTNVRASS